MMTLLGCVHDMDDNLHGANTWFLHFTSSREVVNYRVHDLSLVVTATQSWHRERLLVQQQLDCVSYILWATCLASTGMHVPACCGCFVV